VTDYLDFQIETDPEVIAQLGYDEMSARVPGWDPIPGEIDTALIQANARIASQVRASAGIVPVGIFRYIANQFGLTPRLGIAWTVQATFFYSDTAPHTIPAGTQFAIDAGGGDLRTFALISDVVEADGDSTTGAVLLASVDLDQDNSDVLVGATIQPIDAIPYFLNTSYVTANAYGGQLAETDADFFERIIRRFALQSAAPILPGDFSALALDAMAAGGRAIAIDGYDAVALTTGNARTITIFALDANGAALSSGAKASVVSYIAALREVNWNVYCADPVFFTISVKYSAHAIPGFTPATVAATANAAIQSYLSPAKWGRPAIETLTNWTLLEGWDKVRLGELYQLLNDVEGIAYVDTLFLKAGAVLPTTEVADVSLTGGQVVVPVMGALSATVV
jgi:hypothetical protein